MSDQAPEHQHAADTITTYEIGVMLGYSGDRPRVIRSVAVWLTRHPEITAVGREPGRGGQSLFSRPAVEDIIRKSHGQDAVDRLPARQQRKEITVMQETERFEAIRVTFTDDKGRTVGHAYYVETAAGTRVIAEVHDWNNGRAAEPFEYDPMVIGVFADPGQAEREITERVPGRASVES